MRETLKRGALALLLAAIVAAAAGCGSNGGSAQSAGQQPYDPEANTTMRVAKPPLTKAQFVNRVNEICRNAWVSVRDNWVQFTRGQDKKKSERERFDEAVQFPLLSGVDFYIFDYVRELGAPAGEEEEIEAIIGPFQVTVELGWKKQWHAYTAAEVTSHFETYNERASKYGLDECLVDAGHLRSLNLNA